MDLWRCPIKILRNFAEVSRVARFTVFEHWLIVWIGFSVYIIVYVTAFVTRDIIG